MDDQSFLQLLSDKQPLMWTRGESQALWDQLQDSELLRQSLRSNRALRENAASVLQATDHDLDSLLHVDDAAASADAGSGGGRKWLIAGCLVAVAAIVGVFIYTGNQPEEPPVAQDPAETEEPISDDETSPNESEQPGSKTEDEPAEAESDDPGRNPDIVPAENPSVVAENDPPAEPVVDQPPPPQVRVNGPWDAVMALDPPPRFAEVCFDDFDLRRSILKEDEFKQWIAAVPGEKHKADEMQRNSRRAVRYAGLTRLQSPWTADSWLKLSIVETRQFFIHLFAGDQGITLAHYVDNGRSWSAYATRREPGGHRPSEYALTATDDRRYSRTIGNEDATIMIGWREGELIVCRGDVVLLQAPMKYSPRDVFLEGPALIEGIELVRTADAPPLLRKFETQPLAVPAELDWDTERLTEQATLEKLDGGSMRLSCKEATEPTWVTADIPQSGTRAVIFEVTDYTPGTAVFLKHEQRGISRMYRIMRNTPENRLNIYAHHDHHSWQQDLGQLEERRTAEIGDRLWIKLLQGSHMLRAWISANGEHWAELEFPAAQHNVPITGIGLMLVGGVPELNITLRSLSVQPLAALHSVVDKTTLQEAPAITSANNYGDWLIEVSATQPAATDPAAWRRACAIKSLGAGCERRLADDLLDALLDHIVQSDLPLEQKCDALDDALMFSYGWEDGNKLLSSVIGRYFDAGKRAYLAGETHLPFSSVRRRAMCGPYVHYGTPRVAQTDAAQWELLHLASTGKWNAVLATCEQLEFFYSDNQVQLFEWAEAVAQREAATTVGNAGIVPLKETWRHPLEEELSKETYNLVAELKALLDSGAYVDAARLITQVNPADSAGVAPGPDDPQLLLSLTAAIHWAFEHHPQLTQVMRDQFSDLGHLRVRKAIGEGFAPEVTLAATQFAPTSAAAEAHAWLGDRALSVGRFQQAMAEYRHAISKADSLTRGEIEPRLRLAGAMLGVDLGDPVERNVQLGSASVSASEFEKIVADAKSRADENGASGLAESVATSPKPVPPPSKWDAEKRGQIDGPTGNDHNAGGNRHARELKIPWADRQMAVRVADDLMYFANRFQVSAYRLSDGGRAWQSQSPEGNQKRAQDWPLVPMRPLLVGDRIVTRMLYGEGPQLVCLNRENGLIHWRSASTRTRLFASDPLWIAGDLFVVVWEHLRDRSGRLALCRYDLHSGELLQSHALVPLRDTWFERMVCEVAPLDDGLLVAAGGVLLKASVGGEVDWIRRQPLAPPEEHPGWATQHWQRPIVVAGVAYVSQPGVMALEAVDTESGKLYWSRSTIDISRMLGMAKGKLIVQFADRIAAIELDNGNEAWSTSVDRKLLDGYLLDDSQLLIAARYVRQDPNWEVAPELLTFDTENGQLLAAAELPTLKHADPQIGSMVAADDRIWLLHGRGSHEVQRDLIELKAKEKLATLPPPLPVTEQIWTRRVEPILQDAFSQVAPGWTLWHSHYANRQDIGYRAEDHGRHDLFAALLSHEGEEPLLMARQVIFPDRSRPKLRLVVGAEPGRVWHLHVTVAGAKREMLVIDQQYSNEYWKTIEIDLAEHAGADGWLTVAMKTANGEQHPVFIERVELIQ